MTIKFNVPGSKRKELVKTIAAWLGEDIKYCGAPTFAYEIDYFTVDREGNLIFDDRADSEVTAAYPPSRKNNSTAMTYR